MSRELVTSPSTTTPAPYGRELHAFGLWRRDHAACARVSARGIGILVLSGTLAFTARAAAYETLQPLGFDALDRRRDAPPNEEPYYRGDGVYGRFDGELSLVPALGMNYTSAGWFTQLGISAFYLNTIGFSFRYADGRWSAIAPRADFSVSTLSLAVRPLFLLRWSQNLEQGPSFLDLFIDSLTLSVGSYWSQQHSIDRQRYGLELELSCGFPLLGRAHGPWLTAFAGNRMPKVTHADASIDMAYGLRFEWSFSLGN